LTEIACAADLPQDWFPLPLDEDAETFGRRFAETVSQDLREQAQVELSADHVVDLAHDVTAFTRHAQDMGAAFAAVHVPDPTGPVVAVVECLAVDTVEAGWSHDLAELAREVAAPDETVARADVDRVELPCGEAVRVHEITARSEPGGRDVRGTAVEKVMHYLPRPEQGATVVLVTSWAALGLAEQLVPMADRIAASLTVD
jgi:hypothetical protein